MSSKSNKYRFLLRCDAGPNHGYGHLARCKAIYSALAVEGHDCHVLLNPEGAETALARDLPPEKMHTNTLKFENICRTNFDAVVIDHYTLDSPTLTNSTLIRLNDIPANAPVCDILIDTNFGRSELDYTHWAINNRKVLAGHQYALLDNRFQQLQKHLNMQDFLSRQRLFINFGGIDSKNLTLETLRALEIWAPSNIGVDIVVGKHHHDLENIVSHADRLKNAGLSINLEIDSNNVPHLLAQAGFAIGTAGNSMWERCSLSVPALVFAVAENQKAMIGFAVSEGVAGNQSLPCPAPQLAHLLQTYWDDVELRYKMALAGPTLCDGKGANRVAEYLVSQLAGHRSAGLQ